MYIFVFICVVILFLLFAHVYLQHFSPFVRRTSHIPGPKPRPLIGNFFDFEGTPTESFSYMLRMWKVHGDTFKLSFGPKNVLVTSVSRHFEVLLSCSTNISKGITYTYLIPWLGTGLLTSTGHKWKIRRKLLTPAFHFKTLETFLDSFNKNGNILVEKLKSHVNGGAFNVYEYINLNTLDVICETALGITVDAQENKSSEYVAAVKGLASVFVERHVSPWLHFDLFFFKWSSAGKKQAQCLNVLHSASNKVIKERREAYQKDNYPVNNKRYQENQIGTKKRQAFLDLLLEYSGTNGNLTNEDIREEVDTFMFEGHDTTASAIAFCLNLLALHPNIQNRAYDELKRIFGISDRSITPKDLSEMKYLECVIKESLRLYPSVPFFSRELDTDVKFDELDLPAGTNVCFNVFCLHRNPEIFPEPEVFNPDRFLPENAQGRDPFAFVPFSAGPRNCIGQKFAMMELKSIISKVLRKYRLIADETHEIKLSWEFVLCSANGVFLRIVEREFD